MKLRALILLVLAIFLISFVSADIIIVQNPSNLYNLGNTISVPAKITSLSDVDDILLMKLICGGVETELYREPISISAGQEIERNPPILLIKSFIGDLKGTCRIKYIFGSETKLTNEFTISDLITISLVTQEREFAPGQQITIEGNAKRENGEAVNGFVDMDFVQENDSKLSSSNTVKNGAFTLEFSIPKETSSGQHLLEIKAYEKDSKGNVINMGNAGYNIFVKQVPTSLETFVENKELEPGETLRVKAILYDQTGQQISSGSTIEIKDSKGKIIEQAEISTDTFLEFKIPENNQPEKWSIKSFSNSLESRSEFSVKAVEKISTEIIDKTLIITNTGNVPYNHTLLIKIGQKNLNIDIDLDVGESQKYSLSAPDGKYDIDVVVDGQSSISEGVFLTGKAVEIQKSGLSLENNTAIWIIIILILAFFGLRLFRRWHKRSFFGYPGSKKQVERREESAVHLRKSSLITRNKAEMELSIKGDQQDVSLICLKIKNLDKLKESKTDYEKVLQSIIDIAEEQRGYLYGAQDNLFMIYAPTKTKTFRNERTAIDIAKKISEVVNEYNKLAREKILLGISVNYGTIIASSQGNVLKFMAMGTLMNSSKKLASLSSGEEVLLSERMRDKLGSDVKTSKKEVSGVTAYTIREIRDEERSKEFIRRFMDRMNKGK